MTASEPRPSFLGRSFYLDLRSTPEVRKNIQFGIESLQGTIENFLSPEVKYIVTDRPDDTWPKKDQAAVAPQAAPVPQPVMLPPAATGVAAKALMSRAKMIMDKASKQQTQTQAETMLSAGMLTKSTTDVLETAVRLGVKIIAASKMIEFLDQNVHMPGSQKTDQSPSVMKSVKAIPMVGTFIKVEANDRKSRPIAKVFRTWPDLVLEPGTGCPFRLTSVSPEISDRMVQEQKKKQQLQLNTTSTKESNSHRLQQQLPDTPNLTPQNGQHSRIIAGGGRRTGVASWSRITPQTHGQTTNTGRTLVRAQQGVKRKVLFCELCGVEYENLNDHLKTHTHERYLNDPDNFKELMGVISSLPQMSDLEAANLPVERRDSNEGDENIPPPNKVATVQAVEEDEGKTEATEANETSAYDVNYLKNRMQVATIGSPNPDGETVPLHADDMEL